MPRIQDWREQCLPAIGMVLDSSHSRLLALGTFSRAVVSSACFAAYRSLPSLILGFDIGVGRVVILGVAQDRKYSRQ
jgi:hypothetical protein